MGIQDIVADGQLLIASLIAVAAGLVSFLSPCVLPLVPGYLGYVGASAASGDSGTPGRGRLVSGALLFVAGFSVVLVAFIAAAGTVGLWLFDWQDTIIRVMGGVIILLGLVFMGLFSRMQRNVTVRLKPRLGIAGAPVLGAVFAVGWTPCMGPTLGMIMTLGVQQNSVPRAVALAIAYCLGLGLPFILAAFGFGWMTQTMSFFKKHIRAVNLIGGSLLILIGLLMVTGIWSTMMYALQAVIDSYVPAL